MKRGSLVFVCVYPLVAVSTAIQVVAPNKIGMALFGFGVLCFMVSWHTAEIQLADKEERVDELKRDLNIAQEIHHSDV